MDDPTKDTIPRSAVEYCLRKETVSTNPEAYKAHKKFIEYMDDPEISQFGHWMHSNGFNCALVSIAVYLDKIPSVTPSAQPGWIPCKTALPEHDGEYLVTIKAFTIDQAVYADIDIARYKGGKWRKGFPVTAWQPLPTPYREGGQDNGKT